MKKVLIYLLIFLLIFFILPALFTKNKAQTDNEEVETKNNEDLVSKSPTIKLLHSKTGEVEEIPMEQYLYGTVSAEMPVEFELEALKAQAIVARTYTMYQIAKNKGKHENADICDDSKCCQAWISKEDRLARWEEGKREENWNKIVQAVNETARKNCDIQWRTNKCVFSL